MAHGSLIDDECLPGGGAEAPTPVANGQNGAPLLTIEVGTSLAEIERKVTLATLEHFGRHKERTAAALGVSLKTLYNRLKEYSTVPMRSDADQAGENSGFGSLR